jgi:hypothetical protein
MTEEEEGLLKDGSFPIACPEVSNSAVVEVDTIVGSGFDSSNQGHGSVHTLHMVFVHFYP